MNQLSTAAFQRAETYLKAQGRPLEQARFALAFKTGTAEAVLQALASYQNPDGGFGHALEPDLRTPASSALATSLFFQVINAHGLKQNPQAQAMIKQALAFLIESLDTQNQHWRIIPPEADASPHAPWWNQDKNGSRFDIFSLNPTAELLGVFYTFSEWVSAGIQENVLADLLAKIKVYLSELDKLEMHDLLCLLRLLETPALPGDFRQLIQETIAQLALGTVETQPEKWGEYCLRPLQVVTSPQSLFYKGFSEAVEANLNYEMQEQDENGAWMPTWSWGPAYPEIWPQAQRDWASFLTLEKLLLFQRFQVL